MTTLGEDTLLHVAGLDHAVEAAERALLGCQNAVGHWVF
jgi:hypothetical protein